MKILYRLLLLFLSATALSAADRPNIIFVLCDDLGWGDLGRFFQNQRAAAADPSEPWIDTPELDRLADEGLQLRSHYVPAPVCVSSRSSLYTGVHQGNATVRNNQFDKALEDQPTLATVLKEAGYATALIGKWGLQGNGSSPASWPAYPTKRGFDFFYGYVRHRDAHSHYPYHGNFANVDKSSADNRKEVYNANGFDVSGELENCYTTDLFVARAKKYITDHVDSNSTPFFLTLALDTPHAVLHVPTQAYPEGAGLTGGLQWLGTPGAMINTAVDPDPDDGQPLTIDSYIHPDYQGRTFDHDDDPNTAEVPWTEDMVRHATMVRRIDTAMGDLVQTLADLGIDDETLLIFTSDNGPHAEDYLSLPEPYRADRFDSFGPFEGLKRDTLEGGIRVPAIVRWPDRVPAGGLDTTPTIFYDWMPTFAELAGIPGPARSNGSSLFPLLAGTGGVAERSIYIEYENSEPTPDYPAFVNHGGDARNQMQVVFLDGYKGIRTNIGSHSDPFRIYDVAADPTESTDLFLSGGGFVDLQQAMKDHVLRLRRVDAAAPRPYDGENVPAEPLAEPVSPGLRARVFEASLPWVPEPGALPSAAAVDALAAGPDLSVRHRDDDIVVVFEGFLHAPVAGAYDFALRTDAQAILQLHSINVAETDRGYSAGSTVSGRVRLGAGYHPLRLVYARQSGGSHQLELDWTPPSGSASLAENLYRYDSAGASLFARDDRLRIDRDSASPLRIEPLDNDFAIDPSTLTLTDYTPAAFGQLSQDGNALDYLPDPGFLGTEVIDYTIEDGSGSDTGEIRIEVVVPIGDRLWLPFDAPSGETVYDAGGGVAGRMVGFDSVDAARVAGRFGGGLRFDGVDDRVELDGFTPPTGTSARTTTAWVRTIGGDDGAIVAWGPDEPNIKWMVRIENEAPYAGALRCEVGGGYVKGQTDLRDDQWHHIAVVLPPVSNPDTGDILLYVDGQLEPVGDLRLSDIDTVNAVPTVGTDAQDRFLQADIDELRIYDRALSSAEVAELYAASRQSAEAWYYRYTGQDSPSEADWQVDLNDGDGFSLFEEFAFGGSPDRDERSDPAYVEVEGGEEGPLFRFVRRNPASSQLDYTIESSEQFVRWDPFPTFEVLSPHPELGSPFEEVRVRPDVSDEPRNFFRQEAQFAD